MNGEWSRTVLSRGDGVAACCCARLLRQAGFRVTVEPGGRPKIPAIMLSESTQRLFRDVFDREDLFDGLPRIRKRVVAWGSRADVLELPHSAVVTSEQVLLDRIRAHAGENDGEPDRPARWRILSSRPLPSFSTEHHFGSRIARVSAVTLKREAAVDTCWVESLEAGWLFLLPTGGRYASLLAVGLPTEKMLATSRVVAARISRVAETGGSFPSHPRIADPFAGAGWLACGSGALGFDPLCGDGTGHAVREAILASAVVRAAADGADGDSLLADYRTRILAGFQKHMAVCEDFYAKGGDGAWWENERLATHRGFDWCREQLGDRPEFRYRLNGFSLESAAR